MENRMYFNIDKFIFGGNAEFTIKNLVSGKGAKYKIRKKGEIFFVSIKNGGSYIYAGYLKKVNNKTSFFQGHNGKFDPSSVEVQGLMWMINHCNKMDNRIAFYHHDRCACCGRKLDDQMSIARGFGPICYKAIFAKN